MLQYHAYGLDVYGIEANPEHVHAAPELIRDRVFIGDALVDTYLFNANTFNIVVCSVLGTTAVADAEHLFREVYRVLTPGGLVVLDVSSAFNTGSNRSTENGTYSRMLHRLGFKGVVLFRNNILARKL
jgi:ubiquinone/menaquinone biosynthesis C-methylase UbiE